MTWRDMIKELRTGKPEPNKTAKVIAGFAAAMGAGGIMFMLASSSSGEQQLFPEEMSKYILIGQFALAGLGLLSALGIYRKQRWGKFLAQLFAVLFLIMVIAGTWFMEGRGQSPTEPWDVNPMIIIFMVIFLAMFGPLVYFAVRYLGRLPVADDLAPSLTTYEAIVSQATLPEPVQAGGKEEKYHHSIFPFGLFATSLVLIGGMMLCIFGAIRLTGDANAPFILFLFIPGLFALDVIYNYLPSSFQQSHQLVTTFIGGTSAGLFNASYPLARLLVYEDGLEVRVFFHCFFIPYDRMDKPADKTSFFSTGFLIKSDLPAVPHYIRFGGFGQKKILGLVNEQRAKYLAGTEASAHPTSPSPKL